MDTSNMHKATSQGYTMNGPLKGGGPSLATLLSRLQVM